MSSGMWHRVLRHLYRRFGGNVLHSHSGRMNTSHTKQTKRPMHVLAALLYEYEERSSYFLRNIGDIWCLKELDFHTKFPLNRRSCSVVQDICTKSNDLMNNPEECNIKAN